MKRKIELKLETIQKEMSRIETFPNYCLHTQWQLLNAQRQVLSEILVQFPDKVKRDL